MNNSCKMSDNVLCKLCHDNLAVNVDLKVESASRKLLQRLLNSYEIDVSVLEEQSSICKQCFGLVLHMSETLEKWSKAQEVLKAIPLDIDDSKIFQIKLEPDSDAQFSEIQEEFLPEDNVMSIKVEEPQTDDIEIIEGDEDPIEELSSDDTLSSDDEVVSSEESDKEMSADKANTDWRSNPQNFFCVCLGPDGLALTILFKDKTKESNIRMLCTCCNQLFATLSDIQKHASKSRALPEYWCGVCDAIYPSFFELKVHERIKKHSRPKTRAMVMRCLKCGTRSKQLSEAIRHENEAHDKSSLECHKCRVTFEVREFFQKHLLKHQTYLCRYPNCSTRYRSLPGYTKHLAWHNNHRSECPIDGCTVIMNPRGHDLHLRTHLSPQARASLVKRKKTST
ncbi:hypothetical protein KR059_002366 [Drosophila kikkawai]|nr:hypothetical protein KR059_002366 [Drosophila kikkawai]